MGIVWMPDYRDYWSSGTPYEPIRQVIPRNRFDQIKSNFHIANNNDLPRNRMSTDKLFKFKSLNQHVLNNCRGIEPEEKNIIDKQIVSYKGKGSSMRQYNPKKPTKWGFKFITRCSSDAIIYDFFLYIGADTFDTWLSESVENASSITNTTTAAGSTSTPLSASKRATTRVSATSTPRSVTRETTTQNSASATQIAINTTPKTTAQRSLFFIETTLNDDTFQVQAAFKSTPSKKRVSFCEALEMVQNNDDDENELVDKQAAFSYVTIEVSIFKSFKNKKKSTRD
jgi:hypothetical protein